MNTQYVFFTYLRLWCCMSTNCGFVDPVPRTKSTGKASGRGQAKSGGKGRVRGKSKGKEPARDLQSVHPMNKFRAQDKRPLFAAMFSKGQK